MGIAVATVFGAGFFFDLFFPERTETRGVKLAWKISAVAVCIGTLADAIAMSVCYHVGIFYAPRLIPVSGDCGNRESDSRRCGGPATARDFRCEWTTKPHLPQKRLLRRLLGAALDRLCRNLCCVSVLSHYAVYMLIKSSTHVLFRSYAFLEHNGPFSRKHQGAAHTGKTDPEVAEVQSVGPDTTTHSAPAPAPAHAPAVTQPTAPIGSSHHAAHGV